MESYQEAKKKFEREYFVNLIKQSNGFISNMGHISGLCRTTICNQLKKLKIREHPEILNNKKDK